MLQVQSCHLAPRIGSMTTRAGSPRGIIHMHRSIHCLDRQKRSASSVVATSQLLNLTIAQPAAGMHNSTSPTSRSWRKKAPFQPREFSALRLLIYCRFHTRLCARQPVPDTAAFKRGFKENYAV